MKRILTISLALLIGLSMSAQIQRTILGFTLGITTEHQARNFYKQNNEDVYTNRDGDLVVGNVKFAGYKWGGVILSFYKGKLYRVRMFIISSKTDAYSIWKSLKESLNKKYSRYHLSNISDPDVKGFSDGSTSLFLYYTPPKQGNSSQIVELTYSDVSLFLQKAKDEESDL